MYTIMTKKESNLPPLKIAVLIDGGFFVKRFNSLYNKDQRMTGEQVADHLYTMAMKHVGNKDILYRIFYYDCTPLQANVEPQLFEHIDGIKSCSPYNTRKKK